MKQINVLGGIAIIAASFYANSYIALVLLGIVSLMICVVCTLSVFVFCDEFGRVPWEGIDFLSGGVVLLATIWSAMIMKSPLMLSPVHLGLLFLICGIIVVISTLLAIPA